MRKSLFVALLGGLGGAAFGQMDRTLDMSAAMLAGTPSFVHSLPDSGRRAIAQIQKDFAKEIRSHGDELEGMRRSSASVAERVAFAQKDKRAIYARLRDRVFESLDGQDAERLRRHAMRTHGPRMLRMPEVARRFQLSPRQRAAIEERCRAFDRQSHVILQEPQNRWIREQNQIAPAKRPGGKKEMEAFGRHLQALHRAAIPKYEALRKAEDRRIFRLLTPAQRKAWERTTRGRA